VIYRLVNSPNFTRAAKKYARNNPDFLIELNTVLRLLSEDPFHTQLKTHKLKGDLREFWACRINYELRIVFKFTNAVDSETNTEVDAIFLATLGTHDEVY